MCWTFAKVNSISPGDDPGDRLHASAHDWACDTGRPFLLPGGRPVDGQIARI